MKSLAIQIRGVSYKPVDLHDTLDASSVILLRANNIDDGKINFDEVVFVDKKKVSQEQLLQKGDVLICASSGSKYLVGKAATVDFDREVTFGAFCKVVRPRNQEDADYISMYFQSPIYRREISSVAIGANINNIRNEHIDALSVRWPSAEKRQDSSSILRKVDLIIRRRKLELQVFDKLIKARFVEMFGDPKVNEKHWDEGVIADYFHVKGGKRIPKGMDYSDSITDHPYLRATDMKNETILDGDIHYIGEEVFQHIKRYTVQGGDIYLTNVGVNLGMAGVIPEKYSGANLTENAVKLVPKTDKFRGIFVANYINSPGIQYYINERKMAVGVPKLAIFRIETMPLIIPPIEKQDEFVSFRAQVDKSKAVVQKALDKAQLLFDSLMQKYFG